MALEIWAVAFNFVPGNITAWSFFLFSVGGGRIISPTRKSMRQSWLPFWSGAVQLTAGSVFVFGLAAHVFFMLLLLQKKKIKQILELKSYHPKAKTSPSSSANPYPALGNRGIGCHYYQWNNQVNNGNRGQQSLLPLHSSNKVRALPEAPLSMGKRSGSIL